MCEVLKSTIDSLSHKYTSRFVATLKSSIDKRLTMYENIDAFLLASALDPRFKVQAQMMFTYALLSVYQ